MSPRAHPPGNRAPRYGVIDIGTNSIKLTVASVKRGRIDGHYFARLPTRLGQGLDRTGNISRAAAARTAAAVAELASQARAHGAVDVVAVGTYAFRAARNGHAVAESIGRRAGVRVRILSGAGEARYVLDSVHARIRRPRPYVMVVDIGGGSAQLIVARRARTLLARSAPLGAVVLTERFILNDPIEPAEYHRMCKYIDTVVTRMSARLPRLDPATLDLVASGGAATTAAAMAGKPRQKTGATVTIATLETLEAMCLAATTDERRGFAGMQPDRADIMPAGLAVLIAFARRAGKRSVKIFEGGWREGIILELAQKAHRSRPRKSSTVPKKRAARKGR